ncbi:Peptide Chain Release Factor eRF1/aRF1, N-terminal [Pseudocohnilembus persalinus]|uniref:Eukaryotic peptide chain release factor subunit 1 n=1 Tax=Pseudocohnilembus persalinus TaxID=266149 RepID=A0A0V0QUI2_PSEPJ|nr:Peptide Chain Release Factor eRF1/aRF1, N-terminal [Pseudocohnilembus persalinus]|eukprot:KRX05899.1 Peptide Chain Release Factor eRF1/aRF1, N-terminal [Pseudocohnilembus persalinus]
MEDENTTIVQQFKIKRLIQKLNDSKSTTTSMISLLIPPNKQISDYTKMLTDEISQANSIKDRVNRQAVQDSMTWVKQKLSTLGIKSPANGLLLYAGMVQTHDGKNEDKIMICEEPYKPITNAIYRCDSKFYTDELSGLLENESPFGFIVIDGHGTVYAKVSGNNKNIVNKFSVDLPKKHNKGGQSSVRFARLRMEKRHNYLTKVAELAVASFIKDDKVTIQGLILAGSGDFKSELKGFNGLDPRLGTKIVGLVDVSYGGENGLNQAIELSQDTLADVKFVQEKNLLSKFYEQISMDTGMIIYGATETIKTLEAGGVESLIINENLDLERVTIKNKETGNETFQIVKHGSATDQSTYKDGDAECDFVKVESLVDWIAENYKDFGAKLSFVSDKSPEGYQFLKGFGGIGGFLRYKMDTDFITNQNIQAWSDDDDDFI